MATSVEAPTFITGEKAVTTAGTALKLATGHRFKSVVVVAKTGNTDQVYVGGSDILSTTNDGMAAGDKLVIPTGAHNYVSGDDIYVNSAVSGEGVDWYAEKA